MTRRGPPGHLTRPSRGAFFPAASGKLLLSLPAAQVPTRIGPPRQQANAAESADTAAESADTAPRAATAPVSKPAVFLIEPWTIQSVLTHRQHLLPILPTLPIFSALPIPTLRPPCLNQRCFVSVSPRRIFLPGLDSPPSSPCSSKNLRCRFCRLCRFRRRCRFQHCPPCLNQRCFVSVSPRQIFLPGLDSPSPSPCSSQNLRCRFSPTNLQPHKSALPNLPTLSRGLPLPQCLNQQSFSSSLGLSSPSRPIASTRCQFCRLCRFHRRCRFQHCAHRV